MPDGWDSYPHDWDERRRAVYQRDEYQCQNCGRRGGAAGNAELHCHHIVPKSKGGSHDATNLVTLCRNCHNQVHDHHIPKMSEVNSGGRNQNAGLDDWQSSTQASESLQAVANKHFESDKQKLTESDPSDNNEHSTAISPSEQEPLSVSPTELRLFFIFSSLYFVLSAATYLIGGRGLLEAYNQWVIVFLVALAVFRHFFTE